MGRKPKPAGLKTTDRSDIAGRPTFTDASLNPPSWLCRRGKALWRKLAPELSANKLLTVVDADTLGQMCQAFADYREAVEILKQEGKYHTTNSGVVRPHPAIKLQRDSSELYYKLAREFGINPAARCRVITEKPSVADELETFLEGAA